MVRGRLVAVVLLSGASLVGCGDEPPARGPVPAAGPREAPVPPGTGEIRRVRPRLLPDPPRGHDGFVPGPWEDGGTR